MCRGLQELSITSRMDICHMACCYYPGHRTGGIVSDEMEDIHYGKC
ncbi:MAG: hypothetical protein OSJ45_07430 [Lachnospiraceae bacterium]|nr:hypothetical protein [Lachnospiraceae bacterium]